MSQKNTKELLQDLEDILQELHERGEKFIFSHILKEAGNTFATRDTISIDGGFAQQALRQYWAMMASSIASLAKNCPEKDYQIFKDSFVNAIRNIQDNNFQSLSISIIDQRTYQFNPNSNLNKELREKISSLLQFANNHNQPVICAVIDTSTSNDIHLVLPEDPIEFWLLALAIITKSPNFVHDRQSWLEGYKGFISSIQQHYLSYKEDHE